METIKPLWKTVRQSPGASGSAASAIGLVLNYAGREARLSISLGRPLNTIGPERELIIAELKLLQSAIANIVT